MKRCPECDRTYPDETLAFCLADGALLSAAYDPEATQRITAARNTNQPTEILPADLRPVQPAQRGSGPRFTYITVALLALLAGGGIVFWLKQESKDAVPNQSRAADSSGVSAPSAPSPASSPNSTSPNVEVTTPAKTPVEKPASAPIEGNYNLYVLNKPGGRSVGRMTITTLNETDFAIRGKGWKGSGRIDGKQGYYDWRFDNGQTGRTTFVVNSDGSLRGHVLGSGMNWRYLARRAPSAA